MGEFKKGDFVRVLHTDYHEEFPVGCTFKVGAEYGHGVEPEGEHSYLFFLNYEIEPWQPRVGERVRVKESANFMWAGEGIVDEVRGQVSILKMKTGKNTGCRGGFYVNDLEPILTTTTIVALIENGQPKPSTTPQVHTSAESADKEAKRLAGKYKGKQFGVFTLTATHEEAAPVYDHQWQNLAVMGLKGDATKVLRDMSGLTFDGARSAVEAWLHARVAA